MNDLWTVDVVWYPDGDASAPDVCVNDTEEEMIELWSFPNDADEEEWTW